MDENQENKAVTQASYKNPPHKWQPGESGNPAGRPRKSEAEKQIAAELKSGIQNLGDTTLAAIEKILNPDNKVQAMARVKMIEIILAYIIGKPSQEVKLNISTDEMAEMSEIRIAALVQAVRKGKDLSAGYEAVIEPDAEDQDYLTEGDNNVEP